MTGEIQRCYRALELEPGASLEQVKQAWRELVKVWHPDRFPNDAKLQHKAQERLKEINGAYETLEQYLISGTSPRSRPTSSQSSETNGQKSNPQQETKEERTKQPPPPKSEKQTTSAPAKSNTGIIWGVVIGVVIMLLVLANSGSDSKSTASSGLSGYGNPPSGSGSGYAPVPAYAPPISKALDEKNGFKDFKFGMTLEEARAVMSPSETAGQPGANVTNFYYRATSANRIGDFSADILSLSFFEGRLYRIDLHFSNSQNEILEAFKVNFGEPFDTDTWKRGAQPLHAKAWQGNKVSAAILAMPGQLWDSAVIYDNEANKKAQEFAAKEPERAAKDFGTNGFKSLLMGMKLQDVTLDFAVAEDDQAAGVKKIIFKREGYWQYFQSIGFYRLTSVSAEFFQDKLYRVDLAFGENRKEIFATFKQRFGSLQDNDTWTRGSMKLKAKSAGNDKLVATILSPQVSYGGGDDWDAIILLDVGLWKEAEQFKKDAPKRAAKDF